MKKIKFEASWASIEQINKRLFAQFLTPEIDLSNVEFVSGDNFDIVFCCNYIMTYVPDKPIYMFPHEPHWSGCHQKNFQDNVTVLGFDKNLYSGGKCIESHTYMFYGGIGPHIDDLETWNYNNIINSEFKKTLNISSSITTLDRDIGPTCLYPKRIKLLYSLLNEAYINLHGCGSLLEKGNNVKNTSKKFDIVSPYKFTLTIENTHSKNYVSEKFYDAILTDCIPIYYGASNIRELHPEDGYILLPDLEDIDSIKKLLKEINDNADDIYKTKIDNARKIKQKYFKDHNPIKKMLQIAEQY